jgi:ATP-binding cassette subfamily B protein
MNITSLINAFVMENKFIMFLWLVFTLIMHPIYKVIIPKYHSKVISAFKDKKHFWSNIKILSVYFVVYIILETIIVYITKYISPKFNEFITSYLFKYVIDHSKHSFDHIQTGEVISKITQLPTLFFSYLDIWRTIILYQISIFATGLYHYYFISTPLFLTFVGFIILNYLVVGLVYTLKYDIDVELFNQKAIMYEHISDVFNNLVSVYSLNQERVETNKFQTVEYQKYNNVNKQSLNIYAKATLLWNCFTVAVYFILNYLLYDAYRTKQISSEVLIATFGITLSLITVYKESITVTNEVTFLYGEIGDLENYFNNIPLNIPTIESNLFTDGVIEFKKVFYKYKNTVILDNVSFKINQGDKILITGSIGSGKTTIIKLLMKYNTLLMGSIKINHIDINSITSKQIRKNIYYIPQHPKLFNRTLYENITYGLKVKPSTTDIIALMKKLKLNESKFAEKMSELVGVNGNTLSGGQKQLVWLLRAFYRNKKIIIMDEPTASLDQTHKDLLIGHIKTLCMGKTLIIISHDNIDSSFKRLHLDNGKLNSPSFF